MVMYALDLVTEDSYLGGKIEVWQRTPEYDSSSAKQLKLPSGIDLVAPREADGTLVVYGTAEGISQLKTLIGQIDQEHKKVSLRIEIIEVPKDETKKLSDAWCNANSNPEGNSIVGLTTGDLAKSLRDELAKIPDVTVNPPILVSTINNFPIRNSVSISTPDGMSATSIQLLPRINADGTLTLTLMPSITDPGPVTKDASGKEIREPRFQTLYTRRRVMDGETIVVGGFIRDNKEMLFFVTPTVVK